MLDRNWTIHRFVLSETPSSSGSKGRSD